jgi:hypothetical protein
MANVLLFFDFAHSLGENYCCQFQKVSPPFERIKRMKKTMLITVLSVCLSFIAGVAMAEKVHDWADLERAHNHVLEAMKEMDRARAANHYDMAGHGAKAEEHLRAAEHELHDSIEAARAAR